MTRTITAVADRTRAARRRLDPEQRRSVAGMVAVVAALHVAGWGVLLFVVAPAHYPTGGGAVFGAALGLTAYTLGMRHAFDADHIAAIDNTTRKLMGQPHGGRPQRPVSVGFWFSLGHSSVVFALVLLLALGVRALTGQLEDDSSLLQRITGVVGTALSGTFLLAIGVINLTALVGIVGVFRRMRHGELDEAALERQLNRRGVINRVLPRATRAVSRPWQMYPVGLLFGLGCDTATEIGLLVLAGGAAAFSLPWYAILTLPVLFAAGMSLLDSLDGCFMNVAYGWAFDRPVRKVFYNLTVTSLSVLVALVIGGIELLSILVDKTGIGTGPLAAIAGLDLNDVGFVVVGLFVLVWLAALAVWRLGRVEERWAVRLARSPTSAPDDGEERVGSAQDDVVSRVGDRPVG